MKDLDYKKFADINLSDPFFQSLCEDYKEFPSWFMKKAAGDEKAYVFQKGGIQGFLYLKLEKGKVTDVNPEIPNGKHLKIGTLKLNGHGTKLGQRFVKKVFDHALDLGVDDVYVTIFEKHAHLLKILKTYGFFEYANKETVNGKEIVLLKDLKQGDGDILDVYPRVKIDGVSKHLLAIYPEYHSKFLPDSKLNNESFDIVQDVSHANSIHKIYISGITATGKLSRGDILLLYRTKDGKGPAYYRSVATSVGVVEEARRIKSFATEKEFMRYVAPYSVFSKEELTVYYLTKKNYTVIKFSYNIALKKRVIRKFLLEDVGLPAGGQKWDFMRLTPEQFDAILTLGQVNESYIVD